MAQALPLALASIQEYLDFEETTSAKHELFRGRIYAMAGGKLESREHRRFACPSMRQRAARPQALSIRR